MKQSGAEIVAAFNARYWGLVNPLCARCGRTCRQSSRVVVVHCASYRKAQAPAEQIAQGA